MYARCRASRSAIKERLNRVRSPFRSAEHGRATITVTAVDCRATEDAYFPVNIDTWTRFDELVHALVGNEQWRLDTTHV